MLQVTDISQTRVFNPDCAPAVVVRALARFFEWEW